MERLHSVVELTFTSSVRFLQPGLLLKGVGSKEGGGEQQGPRRGWRMRKAREAAAVAEGLAEWQVWWWCGGDGSLYWCVVLVMDCTCGVRTPASCLYVLSVCMCCKQSRMLKRFMISWSTCAPILCAVHHMYPVPLLMTTPHTTFSHTVQPILHSHTHSPTHITRLVESLCLHSWIPSRVSVFSTRACWWGLWMTCVGMMDAWGGPCCDKYRCCGGGCVVMDVVV